MEVVVIGDVHGCYLTFRSLLDKVQTQYPGATICLVGDVIDRGPRSKEMIEYLIDHPEIKVVRANHEQMAIDSISDQFVRKDWINNGGSKCLYSYDNSLLDAFNGELFLKHVEWMKSLPLYIEFPDCLINDRYLVVSHASIGSTWKHRNIESQNYDHFCTQILWNRDTPKDIEEIYNVFGHTPVESPKVKSFYANIDTGACYNRGPYTKLSAIHLPSLQIISQEVIDYI